MYKKKSRNKPEIHCILINPVAKAIKNAQIKHLENLKWKIMMSSEKICGKLSFLDRKKEMDGRRKQNRRRWLKNG